MVLLPCWISGCEPWKPTSDHFDVEEQRSVLSIRHLDQVIYQGELAAENLHRHGAAAKSYQYSRAAIEFEVDIYNVMRVSHTTTPCDIDGNVQKGQDAVQLYPKLDNSRRIHGLSTGEQFSVLTPEVLSNCWHIGLNAARQKMGSTTQAGIKNVLAPGERKVRQSLDHLKYTVLKGRFYSYTSFFQVKSTKRKKCRSTLH